MKNTRKMKREVFNNSNMFKDILTVINHYFPKFINYFQNIDDPS